MNAIDVKTLGVGETESFGGARTQTRLSAREAEDLRYLWQSYAADLGIRSLHGMIERQLLLKAPPRDVQQPVLEELERAGGRAPEGRIVRLVTLERWGTRAEVRLAIAYLCRTGKRGPRIERIPVDRPDTPTTCSVRRTGRACSHPCSSCEWTGFDLRMTERGERELLPRLALTEAELSRTMRRSREELRRARWAAQDDRLEREIHTMTLGPDAHAPGGREELLGARQRAAVNRATAALSKLTAFDVRVLQLVYGELRASEDAEVEAVRRRMTGGNRDKAEKAIAGACAAYRLARAVGR